MAVLDRFRLDGKRLFITGGSRGLGREMALAIAEAGAPRGGGSGLSDRRRHLARSVATLLHLRNPQLRTWLARTA